MSTLLCGKFFQIKSNIKKNWMDLCTCRQKPQWRKQNADIDAPCLWLTKLLAEFTNKCPFTNKQNSKELKCTSSSGQKNQMLAGNNFNKYWGSQAKFVSITGRSLLLYCTCSFKQSQRNSFFRRKNVSSMSWSLNAYKNLTGRYFKKYIWTLPIRGLFWAGGYIF